MLMAALQNFNSLLLKDSSYQITSLKISFHHNPHAAQYPLALHESRR